MKAYFFRSGTNPYRYGVSRRALGFDLVSSGQWILEREVDLNAGNPGRPELPDEARAIVDIHQTGVHYPAGSR